MSTDIAIIVDGVEPEVVCEVYRGTGGTCLFVRRLGEKEGVKFWLNETNIDDFEWALQCARGNPGRGR